MHLRWGHSDRDTSDIELSLVQTQYFEILQLVGELRGRLCLDGDRVHHLTDVVLVHQHVDLGPLDVLVHEDVVLKNVRRKLRIPLLGRSLY